MVNIKELKFDEKGLIPAIVADAKTKKVLTLAYMNEESLNISLEKGLTCFWSRSRQELWLKGETSGNYQHIVSITADCDRDALLVLVDPDGPACHLGTESCFEYPVWEHNDGEGSCRSESETADESTGCPNGADDSVVAAACLRGSDDEPAADDTAPFSYEGLMDLIDGRKTDPQEGSYTTYLFEKGLDKILKKIGEESTEVIIAAKTAEETGDNRETIYEIADLAYHVMVLMTEAGIRLEDIRSELASRHVIDKKVKQEKMV